MADSYRLTVMKALTALLEDITVANGFDYNLAGCVFRGRSVFGADSPPTMVSILEAPRPDGNFFTTDQQARNESWLLLVQGFCPDEKENPSDPVYQLADAVETQLHKINALTGYGEPKHPQYYRLGNQIADAKVNPPIVRPPSTDISPRAFFYLPLQLTLVRKTG